LKKFQVIWQPYSELMVPNSWWGYCSCIIEALVCNLFSFYWSWNAYHKCKLTHSLIRCYDAQKRKKNVPLNKRVDCWLMWTRARHVRYSLLSMQTNRCSSVDVTMQLPFTSWSGVMYLRCWWVFNVCCFLKFLDTPFIFPDQVLAQYW